MMKRPQPELLKLARANITFPLACFLVGAQPGAYFCYSWGYTDRHGSLESYPELERPLGPPRGAAEWNGMSATRQFELATVRIDLTSGKASIDWR